MFPKQTKILVVDDLTTMRRVLSRALKQLGYQNIAEASCGKSAWDMIQRAMVTDEPYGLVLSDSNMPSMHGIELLKLVRLTPTTANLPFILVTAESEKQQIDDALRYGASHTLVKPFTASVIEQRLQSVHRDLAA